MYVAFLVPGSKMIKGRLMVMGQDSCIFLQEIYLLQGLQGFTFQCPVKDCVPYAEVPDIILFPVYGYRRRVGCHHFLVQKMPFQMTDAFLRGARQLPAEPINASL